MGGFALEQNGAAWKHCDGRLDLPASLIVHIRGEWGMVQGDRAVSKPSQADFIGGLALALMVLAILASLVMLIALTNPG